MEPGLRRGVMMRLVLFVLGGLLVGLTILSRVRSAKWWNRYTDFPRVQIAAGLAIVLAAYVAIYGTFNALDAVFTLAVGGALLDQGLRIFPYTPLAPKEVVEAHPGNSEATIRILISNVLMENRRAEDLLALVREKDPDLLLAVETDNWWHKQLAVLDGDYPYSLKQPQSNYYGMHFFSKLELRSPAVRFLVEGDVPSVRARIRLRSGHSIEFYGIHPRPPEVKEDGTKKRDAESCSWRKQIKADQRGPRSSPATSMTWPGRIQRVSSSGSAGRSIPDGAAAPSTRFTRITLFSDGRSTTSSMRPRSH